MTPMYFEVHPLPLAEFRERILDLYRPPLRAGGTFQLMRRSLDLLAQLGCVETTADLTTATIARFVGSRAGKENPNTTRGHLRSISAACTIAAAEGWLRISPFAVRKGWVRAVTTKAPRIHSREEIARVLALARSEADTARGSARWKARRLHALTATVAYTGLRRTEALTLRVEDIDLDARMIILKARVDGMLKTEAAAQPVPIPDALALILRPWIEHITEQLAADLAARQSGAVPCPNGFHSWLNVRGPKPPGVPAVGRPAGGHDRPIPPPPSRRTFETDLGWLIPNLGRDRPWVGGSMGKRPCDALQALGRRAGVEGFTFQSLRHSWATHAEFWGLSDAVIQRVLRHTNLRTQHRYRHAEANNLRALVGGIDFGQAEGNEGGDS